MSSPLPSDVRARIDAHLDAVEGQLQSTGTPREKRRAIVDDLETQIFDMLAAHAFPPVTVDDVNAVLGKLDPPQAYTSESASSPTTSPPSRTFAAKPELCPRARKGARWLAASLFGQFVLLALLFALFTPVGQVQGPPPRRRPLS